MLAAKQRYEKVAALFRSQPAVPRAYAAAWLGLWQPDQEPLVLGRLKHVETIHASSHGLRSIVIKSLLHTRLKRLQPSQRIGLRVQRLNLQFCGSFESRANSSGIERMIWQSYGTGCETCATPEISAFGIS